jgi:beta-phosphoglucomutase-like phosphatase (HAD superfamily)
LRQHFACVATRDDVERVKPDPALFLRAAACLGVDPHACLVFEDSVHGMHAARAAGMHCVAVPGPMTRDMTLPEVVLRLGSLADLPLHQILDRVNG